MKKALHLSKKIAIAVSGGVDSSVAAYLLKQAHGTENVFGLHMSNWNTSDEESENNYCEQSERDARDAQHVCDKVGIDMHRVEFVSEYWNGVFEPFVQALSEQRMINPDVGCNTVVKFGVMRDYAMKKGADYIATGHYARVWHRGDNNLCRDINGFGGLREIEDMVQSQITGLPEEEWISKWGTNNCNGTQNSSTTLLLSGADLSKDQSYFLCNVNSIGLSNAIFPLGNLMKKNEEDDIKSEKNMDEVCLEHMSVRNIALAAGLPTASKKDSMGICFVGKRKFADFISQYLPEDQKPGNFVDIDTGEIVGTHHGSAHYTVGQGAKISGASLKWFIAIKHPDGTVFVCDSTHHPSLYSNELYVKLEHFNWITGESPPPLKKGSYIPAMCRTRHLQPLIPCNISIHESYVKVKFDRPIRAVTPGQTAAVYIGNGLICLGGGQIWMHGPTYHELGLDLPSKLHPAGNNDLSISRIKMS